MPHHRYLPCLVLTLATGCAGLHDCCYSVQQKHCATKAYKASGVDPSVCGYPCDFKEGWINGYYDVAMGSNGCLPPVPPKKYWKCQCGTSGTRDAAAAWYNGYEIGAMTAKGYGAGCCNSVPMAPTAALPDQISCADSRFLGPTVQDQRPYRANEVLGPTGQPTAPAGESVAPATPSEPLQAPTVPTMPSVAPEFPSTPPSAPAAESPQGEMEQSAIPVAELPRQLSMLQNLPPVEVYPAASEPIVLSVPKASGPILEPVAATPSAVAPQIQRQPQAAAEPVAVSTPALDFVAPVSPPTPDLEPIAETFSPIDATLHALPPVVEAAPMPVWSPPEFIEIPATAPTVVAARVTPPTTAIPAPPKAAPAPVESRPTLPAVANAEKPRITHVAAKPKSAPATMAAVPGRPVQIASPDPASPAKAPQKTAPPAVVSAPFNPLPLVETGSAPVMTGTPTAAPPRGQASRLVAADAPTRPERVPSTVAVAPRNMLRDASMAKSTAAALDPLTSAAVPPGQPTTTTRQPFAAAAAGKPATIVITGVQPTSGVAVPKSNNAVRLVYENRTPVASPVPVETIVIEAEPLPQTKTARRTAAEIKLR